MPDPPASTARSADVAPTPAQAADWLRELLAGDLRADAPASPAGRLGPLLDAAADLAGNCLSPHTLRVYGSGWAAFAGWCHGNGVRALPADPVHVAAYIASLYGAPRPLRPATVAGRITAINTAHRLAGFPEPARTGPARAAQNGARRRHGTAIVAAKDPLTLDVLRPAVSAALDDPGRRRDRAVAALTGAGLRPTRIAALRWEDVRPDGNAGWRIRPSRRGRPWLAVPAASGPGCPAAAIAAARPTPPTGPVCAGTDRGPMTPQGVGKLIRRVATAAGTPLPAGPRPVLGRAAARLVLQRLAEPGLAERRDAALLLVGFVGGLRRSGLAGLTWDDIVHEADGDIRVTVRRQKNDMDAAGHTFWFGSGNDSTTCPVRALERWRAAATAALGTDPAGAPGTPVFMRVDRTGRIAVGPDGRPLPLAADGIHDAVARACSRAGHARGRFGSHSLRSGMITEAAGIEGVTVLDIQLVTGHQNADSVLRYVRPVVSRRRTPTRRMGL